MKAYIGTKLIKAEPMNRGDYNKYRGWPIPADESSDDKGYLIKQDTGYETWQPKDVFEKEYRQFGSDKNTVTQADVDGFIAKKEVSTIKNNTTLVVVTLVNGFVITESSACVDPANYDEKYGAEICTEKIKDKIWFLLGFLLQCGINGLNGGK